MYSKKLTGALCALLTTACAAAPISDDAARAAAAGFLAKSAVAAHVLPGRSVTAVQTRSSLWIAALEPSGCIVIAGSDRCAPVISFSADDFAEPEAGSPLDVLLRDSGAWVEKMEADESAEINAGWAKYTAPAAKNVRLLAASAPAEETSDEYVAPFLGATWHQTAPYNDLSPYNYFCGCVATAAGQEVRYWRWPYRYEKFRTSTHGVRDGLNNYYSIVVRPNGLVPIDWDKVKANYTYESNASTPLANDKVATYNAAYLSFWMQSLGGIGYKPGGSGGTRQLASSAEDYWYEKGVGMNYWNDGYTNLWKAIKADLDWGSPIQINTAAHQMVIDGYAVENAGTADEIDYINLNLGYGNATYWENLRTAVTSGTYSGVLASFQTGYRPQKIVQFEPVPKVCTRDVTLTWHIAPCYTNRTTGFTLEIAGGPSPVPSVNISTHDETTTYTVTGLEEGHEYTFTVTPVMAAGEGTGRTNSVTTIIGTPQPAPEILSVSSVACGIEHVQQDIFVECARGVVNQFKVTCSESTTSLTNYSSHLTILPDEKISVVKDGNVFTVNIDATDMAQRWNVEGEMIVLTLAAKNADGTEAYKNLMLRFNSMRNVMGGTFEIVEPDATGPVWFASGTTTTLDAKGQTVTFDATAFQGNGTVTLTDSVGGGSFTFANLNGFTGTLKWAPSVTVNLPADMTGFSGTVHLESAGANYTLSADLPSTAKLYIGANTGLYLVNTTINAALSGPGVITIATGTSTLGNLKGFTGSIDIGTSETAAYLTLNAGEEKNVSIWNGTLYMTLSDAQVAYGYTTTAIKYNWSTLVFQDSAGKVLKTWTTDDKTFEFAATANTWTPDSSTNYGRFSDTSRWSFGRLPVAGEYVLFKDTSSDGFGSEMQLNLAADMTLEHIKVIGNTKFTVSAADGSATLFTKKFENDKRTTLKTDKIQPTLVIPAARLDMAEGTTIGCEIDSTIAKNLYTPGGVSALQHAGYWNGTVVFENRSIDYDLDPQYWGNEDSKIRFTGATGYVEQRSHFTGGVILKDDGATPALHLTDGYNGDTVTVEKLTGDGTYKTSTKALSETFLVKDVSGFTGAFDLAKMNVAIADEAPSTNIDSDGRLHVCKAATIPADKVWSAAGGLFLGANGALTVNGSLATKQIYAYGANASLTLEDGATIDVQTGMGGDSSPTLNFKAGTYKVENNATETNTVNFCAAAGKRTTLDANGHVVTLGTKFFSGSGDVHLTSSKSGGKFILQGVGADFTGTIYADISAGFTLDGDISQMGGRLNVSDIILSLASTSLGNIDVGAGASLVVTVSKSDRIKGLTIDSVTLSDGGTLVLQDTDGKTLKYTEENGRYILAPDETLKTDALLDYEFNGNVNSIGTDTTALSFYATTAKYYNDSALYMLRKPYISSTFAMPDDEWTSVMRCTLPAANSEKPTIVIMYGVNGGSLFGLVADTAENTIALADKNGLIGEPVSVEDATTKYHVYTIVKTAGRVKLYVDGELRISEPATVSVAKKFQIGSPNGGNPTSYAACDDTNALVDFLKFYDFAADKDFIDAQNVFVVEPSGGTVEQGTEVTMAYDNPSATIWYKKYGETGYTQYVQPLALDTIGANIYYVQVRDTEGNVIVADQQFVYYVTEKTVIPPPEPIAVWTGDFDTTFDGCALDWHNNVFADGVITIADGYQGVDVNLASGTNAITVIVKYSDLSYSPSNGRVFFTSCAERTKTYDRTAVRLTMDNVLKGSHNSSTSSGTASSEFNSDGSVVPAASGYMVFSYGHPTDNDNRGTLVCTGAEEGSLNTTNYWKSGLMFAADSNNKSIYGATIGGTRKQTGSWENAGGMKIEAVAVFAERLDEASRNAYRFPVVTPVEANVAYYKSGGFGGGDALVLTLADGTTPATLTDGGAVIIDDKTNNDIALGNTLPANVGTIRVARDVTFTADAATALDGLALTIDSGATLTIGSNVALGTATVAGGGTIAFAAFPAKPTLASTWTGTVEFPAFRAGGEILTDYCINGTSKLKLKGITGGYLMWNDLDFQSELILAGDFILTDMSTRVFRFAKISGAGNISLSPGNYELTSFTIGELAEGYAGVVSNNMRTTAINIQRLSLSAGASVAPGTKILAAGGTCTINLNEVYVGGVKANVTYERRTNGTDGDGFYVKSAVTAQGGNVTIATDGTVASVAVPLPDGFAGKIVVPASVSTLSVSGANVQSSQLVLETAYGSTLARYENILLFGNGGAVSLDPDGVVGDVAVRPELDLSIATPYDATKEKVFIKAIPGLWYSVIYGDALVGGGIGGATGETEPVQATGATLTLDAPKDGASRFYRIKVVPVLFGIETTETDN